MHAHAGQEQAHQCPLAVREYVDAVHILPRLQHEESSKIRRGSGGFETGEVVPQCRVVNQAKISEEQGPGDPGDNKTQPKQT